MKNCLVILSGGQDSTTCLYWAKQNPGLEKLHALTFDYGQRHGIEIRSASTVAAMAGVDTHELVVLPDNILAGTSPLTNPTVEVEEYESAETLPGGIEKTFVPARNLLFLSIAANRAAVLGCDALVIGVSEEDFGGYPDCRSDFITAMEAAINAGLPDDCQLTVYTPLINRDKRETVELAAGLDGCLDALAYSHTCYNGDCPPCGKCHACLLRARGFDQAGIEDPLLARCTGQLPEGLGS